MKKIKSFLGALGFIALFSFSMNSSANCNPGYTGWKVYQKGSFFTVYIRYYVNYYCQATPYYRYEY